MRIDKLSPAFAAEISDFRDSGLFDDEGDVIATLREAIATHRLLRLRGIQMTPREMVDFASNYGRVTSLRRANNEGAHFRDVPEIKVVSNGFDADGIKRGDGDSTENRWHTDGTYLVSPTELTFLYGRKAPVTSPRTLFMDMIEAYHRLPTGLKDRIAGRSAVHYSIYNHDAIDTEAVQSLADPADRKRIGRRLPLVISHSSGEPCLLLPRQVDCVIDGLSDADSASLAAELWAAVTDMDCWWGEAILPDDLFIWDNRYLLHMREAFSGTDERLLWHTTTDGARYVAFEEPQA